MSQTVSPPPGPRPERPRQTELSVIARHLGVDADADATPAGAWSVLVSGLSLDSRRVLPGDLYAALPGARTHGAAHAAAAVEAGAVAVLTDPAGAESLGGPEPFGVPVLVVPDPRAVLGGLAALVHGRPAEALTLIGVTGTQGKTTTTRLWEAALERVGTPVAVIGTVGTRIAGAEVRTALTTPEAPDLHALLAVMRERGVRACAMEVSSHALVLGRVDGVRFDVAVFLNLGRDHLDFHRDVEDYFEAKAELFTPERARTALVNVDDEYGRRLRDTVRIPVRTFSVAGDGADWCAEQVVVGAQGTDFVVRAPDGSRFPARVPLVGEYNVANALAAVAAAGEAGLDPVRVAAALGEVTPIAGRLERIENDLGVLALVDYAHKPDAVTAALGAVRPLTAGRVLMVLGAGGDRDPGKRPLMGAAAARDADVLVVTDDNPRSEDPAAIRAAVLAGARQIDPGRRAELVEIADRREAIRHAVGRADRGDVVLVAGKGHETGQEIGGVVHPFDDRDELRSALAARSAAGDGGAR